MQGWAETKDSKISIIALTNQYLNCLTTKKRVKNIYSKKESLVLRYNDIKNNLIISEV